MNPQNLDPVDWIVLLLSPLLSKPAAEALGPIAVIIIFAAIGAGWSLSRIDKQFSRAGLVWYVSRVIGLALCITTLGAKILSTYLDLPAAWLVGPVALIIAAVGDDWNTIGRWAVERVGTIVSRKTGA